MPVQPGPSGMRPYAIGAATSLTCLLCFAWPPLRRLSLASPLRVLRRDMPTETRRTMGDYGVGLIAVTLLMLAYSQNWKLTFAVLAGLAITVVLGMALALTLLRGGRLLGMSAGSIWRLALAGLQRRGNANALQVVRVHKQLLWRGAGGCLVEDPLDLAPVRERAQRVLIAST